MITAFLILTGHLLASLFKAICVGFLIYFFLLFIGLSGVFDVVEHEDVDLDEKVVCWNDSRVKDKLKNSDYTGPRLEVPFKISSTERLGNIVLHTKKDQHLLDMLVAMCLVLVPMAVMTYALFMHSNFYVALAFALVYNFIRITFFMNGALHYRHFTAHSPIFKFSPANILPNIFLDPLMGIPPVVFLVHHIYMHHLGNNGVYDISTTEPYNRVSWISFANYWLRFQLGAYLELPNYCFRTDKIGWGATTIAIIGTFFYIVQYLADAYSGWATFFVFATPWMLDHGSDAIRNWCQHMFVVQYNADTDAENIFEYCCGLAYNLVDSVENRLQYNEGYHVLHHAHGGAHWSTIPDLFYEKVEQLKDSNHDIMCITFQRTSIWSVWAHAASNKLPQLVKNHYIHIPTKVQPDAPTIGQVVNELKARLQPIDLSKRKDPNFPRAVRRKQFQRLNTKKNFAHIFG